ncbi:serine/threonine-protein kinase EDR1 [Magnolia sinica]|uniref:serine/threonine-protein kinase EDR1 n=1 Tax=Magnolia sinica TaxID=86752 RepID=UPI0026587BB4|nr:serine/threonine-protein kinase EDR1 [Magnolia sinica]
MSRMKHLLRKLHIGGSVNDHQRLGENRQNSPSPSSSSSPASSSSSATATATASARSRTAEAGPPAELQRAGAGAGGASAPSITPSDGSVDFNFFEEEFQVQLALAISVSDPDSREDPESAQINAAKRISLGCTPSPNVEFLSLRYWNYNVVDYDEKVVDGFYDVYGIVSNPNMQGKLPSLVDLQAISISDNVDYEVVLVNRTVDHKLQQLERRVASIASQCQAAQVGPAVNGLVQKIADLVVESMGGPVGDADDMLRRWTIKSYELRNALNSIVLPLGCLEVGLSRHRALLFKVLADRIGLQCRLVKGSYYTGTDEGAVNIIKIDQESEYIIDLMGAPGTLIPAEIPSSHLQNSGLNLMSSATMEQTVKDLCLALDNGRLEASSYGPNLDLKLVGSGSDGASRVYSHQEEGVVSLNERNQTARFEHEFGKLPSLGRLRRGSSGMEETASSAQQMKVKDVSKYVISAAQDPEFAQKLHAVLLESGASPPPDLFSDINSLQDLVEQKMLGRTYITEGRKIDGRGEPCQDTLLPDMELSLIPFQGVKSFTNIVCGDEQKHLADDLAQKQRQATNVSDSSLGYQNSSRNPSVENPGLGATDLCFPVNANAISPGLPSPLGCTSEWLMIQADSTTVADCVPMSDSSAVVPTASYGEQVREYFMPCTADASQTQPGNAFCGGGAQCFQASTGRIPNHLETRGNVSSPVGQEKINESMARFIETATIIPHTAISNNERSSAMLDDVAEWEIPWEDLQLGERIGLGSYGEVYHADWNGTEVAVKKFLDQAFSGDALEQFRCEVKIMLRLRHPNVVLFMGAVTRPPNLSILTEFLPRGSLYRLLHRPNIQLDEKRRLRMALDVAKGMNYLHTSHPTIVHRDLKSPNLLVDKNWVVKVCDFGLSRLKHHTFLSSKSTAGTPEWMAPEVLRNEPSNEKCDVYSFGVILWELATLRMPWSGMNPMQVVGAVGFQNRRLDIPSEVDPMVAQIICDCWQSDPGLRPSFTQLMAPLKHLKRLIVEVT